MSSQLGSTWVAPHNSHVQLSGYTDKEKNSSICGRPVSSAFVFNPAAAPFQPRLQTQTPLTPKAAQFGGINSNSNSSQSQSSSINVPKPIAMSRPRQLIISTTIVKCQSLIGNDGPKTAANGTRHWSQYSEINPTYDPMPEIGLNGGLAASRWA